MHRRCYPARITRVVIGVLLFGSTLGIDCIKRGPFGEEVTDVEDHTFLIELKNNTGVPVTFREVDTNSGFIVGGSDAGFIRRSATPEQVFRFAARPGNFVSDTIGCTYHPPSDSKPTRRVEWDGTVIRCHFWEPPVGSSEAAIRMAAVAQSRTRRFP